MKKSTTPLSEDAAKYRSDWTPEDCVNEMKRIAEANPEQFITRNFFRNHAECSESTWSRYFGTFREYKRKAGIVPSRHHHKMELQLATHSSMDTYREMSLDKSGWEEKYRKVDKKRFQTILVGSDIHDKESDPFWVRTFIDTAKRVQPEKIVLNGDVFDLPEFGKYTVDPRTWDVVGRIEWVHEFLRKLRENTPSAEIILIEGNHEYRLIRHLAEATPAMKAILADLHGFTIPKLLAIEEYEIVYIARADLATTTQLDLKSELKRNWMTLYDAVLAHHFPQGRDKGMPGWNGHHHKHIVWPSFSPSFGSFEWHQLGAGHRRKASYTDGEVWGTGFLLAHVDTERKHTAFEYIEIRDHAVIGGKWYARTEREIV